MWLKTSGRLAIALYIGLLRGVYELHLSRLIRERLVMRHCTEVRAIGAAIVMWVCYAGSS